MKHWYKLVTPREDLRDGKPLDAPEFAVHLDHVRDGRAPTVYQNPAEFFEHEEALTAPGGDVIEKMLPKGKPTLILLDELMSYVSRSLKSGLAAQLYSFLQNLSEVVRSEDNAKIMR